MATYLAESACHFELDESTNPSPVISTADERVAGRIAPNHDAYTFHIPSDAMPSYVPLIYVLLVAVT
jgi:hypothetical protein